MVVVNGLLSAYGQPAPVWDSAQWFAKDSKNTRIETSPSPIRVACYWVGKVWFQNQPVGGPAGWLAPIRQKP